MKSSSGQYFQPLDHVRALAAFLVFVWHFYQFNHGENASPLGPVLSIFTEGHTGVSIFMTLSGYLFSKLLDGKQISFPLFLWNRALRLLPLLVFVILLTAFIKWKDGLLHASFFRQLLKGVVLPNLPAGGWSITVEFHFYIILPFILWLLCRSWKNIVLVLGLAILVRLSLFLCKDEVRGVAYFTLIGRLDQFSLGIFCYKYRHLVLGRRFVVLLVAVAYLVYWYWFDFNGGVFGDSEHSAHQGLWVVETTIEGLAYAILIAWYDSQFTYSESRVARFVARIGTYSYSIYLLHIFVVFKMPTYIDRHIFRLSNGYLVLVAAIPSFLAFLPVAALSYHLIERPFMRFRTNYMRR